MKPSNIMLTRDGVKVLDFGLAKSAPKTGPTEQTLTALTTEGSILGTPQYMAPEQFEGKEADTRCDIWAVGAVICEMVTGEKAFKGKNYTSLVGAILSTEPAPMSVEPFTPPALEKLVRRCLAKDAEDRYQSMRDAFHASGDVAPGGSPDGSRIVFSSSRDGEYQLYWKNASGAGPEERVLEPEVKGRVFTDWTAAGDRMLFQEIVENRFDLWVMPMTGERKPVVFLKTEFDERNGRFSPGGQWVAYQSNESGRNEIYVQPYPATAAKWQVSRDGGHWPSWRRDGREIYLLDADGTMMAVQVSGGPSAGSPFRRGVRWRCLRRGSRTP